MSNASIEARNSAAPISTACAPEQPGLAPDAGQHPGAALQGLAGAHEQLAGLQQQLAALQQRHEAELQEQRAGELRRLQGVGEEYARLEAQLKAEQERTQAVAAQAASELRDCQQALASAEQQAQEAVREALRAAQQAGDFQAQLLQLRQLAQRQQPRPGAPTAQASRDRHSTATTATQTPEEPTGSAYAPGSSVLGGVVAYPAESRHQTHVATVDAAVLEAQPAQTPAASSLAAGEAPLPLETAALPPSCTTASAHHAAAATEPAAAGATDASATQELQQLRRQCAALERQCTAQREELKRAQSRLAAVEGRLATAVQQVAALNAELRANEPGPDAVAEEVHLRVSLQADADAQLLCALRAQLRECQEQQARREGELAQARREVELHRAALLHQPPPPAPASREPVTSALHAAQCSAGGVSEGSDNCGGGPCSDAAGASSQLGADAVRRAVQRVLAALVGSGGIALSHYLDSAGTSAGSNGDSSPGSGSDVPRRGAAPAAARQRSYLQQQWQQRRRKQRQPPAAGSGGDMGAEMQRGDEDDPGLGAARARYLAAHRERAELHAAPAQLRRAGAAAAAPAGLGAALPSLAVARARLQGGHRATACAAVATQTDDASGAAGGAALAHLQELQQQQAGLLAQVAELRCQAAEAQALASARTTRVAELQAREQQLRVACEALRLGSDASVAQLEDELERCHAWGSDMRAGLDAECRRLASLHVTLQADVRDAAALLRDCMGALRLARVAIRARAAVDDALGGLVAAAAADSVAGPQALRSVQLVFSCMAELCGRAEAVDANLQPCVARLSALASRHEPAQLAGNPSAQDAASARSGAADGASLTAQTAARGSHAVPAAAPLVPRADVRDVHRALRRVHAHLHSRAGKFAQVLKAVAEGRPMPAEDVHAGFRLLWSSVEEQLGRVLRLASGGDAHAPLPALEAQNPSGGSRTEAHAPDGGVSAVLPPSRSPLAPLENVVDMRSPTTSSTVQRAPANKSQALGGNRRAKSPGGGDTGAVPLHWQQPQHAQAQQRGDPQASQSQPQQQSQQQPQQRRRQPLQPRPGAPSTPPPRHGTGLGPEGGAAVQGPGGEDPRLKRRLESQLQHVLSLAKKLQPGGGREPH